MIGIILLTLVGVGLLHSLVRGANTNSNSPSSPFSRPGSLSSSTVPYSSPSSSAYRGINYKPEKGRSTSISPSPSTSLLSSISTRSTISYFYINKHRKALEK